MTTLTHPLVIALFEAHVQHSHDMLTGDGLIPHLTHELDADLANASLLTLNAVVTREMIKSTVHAYAVEMPMAGGIPELVGDIARTLHAHPIQETTRLSDVISDQQVREIIAKAVEMREARERVIHEVLGNPVLAEMAGDLILRGIKGYLAQGNEAAKNIPGASALMGFGKSMLSKASPDLEKKLDDGLQAYVHKSTQATLRGSEKALLSRLNDKALQQMALDFWAEIKHQPASALRRFITAETLEECFVIGYEYWRSELRKTPYYRAVIDTGVDAFFDKYGDSSLAFILEEVGVTRDMILREIVRFAPPILASLHEQGLLDGIIRRQLLPFYASGRIEAVLAAHGV